MAKPLISLKGVHKSYNPSDIPVPVLRGVDLDIQKGELVVVMGPSGCGKTTLLNIIAGIDTADKGLVMADGKDLGSLDRRGLTQYRKYAVGYIFQFYNLIPTLTALENVELALQIKGDRDLKKARQWLARLGLEDKAGRFPSQLSGGEQQRVAIARALVKSPKLVVGDEPTGNLDGSTAKDILALIKKMNGETGTTFVLATHDRAYERIASRVVHIKQGRLA
jgi:putative ABC transport system ATP-binding protein